MITVDSIYAIYSGGLDTNWVMSNILSTNFFDREVLGVIFNPNEVMADNFIKCFGQKAYDSMMEFRSSRFEGEKELTLESEGGTEYLIPVFWYKYPYSDTSYLLMDFQRISKRKGCY